MVKVYLCYAEYTYAGVEPVAVFSTEEKANEWCRKKNTESLGTIYDYMGLLVDAE